MNTCEILSSLKVVVLTSIVIISFLFSTLIWQHVDTDEQLRIIVAAVILVIMYALMVFELINRNLAALIGAAASVAAYDCLVERVDMEQILQWEDLETLSLLFGMMIIVNVLGCSGLFDYLAVWSYKTANGRFWLLITTMSFITAILSAFIDNVSTMLLLSPTLIKLSELEQIDPRYVLMMMVVFCNIGGCATPVGDPPNLIIIGDPLIEELGITFGSFVALCGPCVLITMAVGLLYMRLVYKSKESFKFADSNDGTLVQHETSLSDRSKAEQIGANLTNELDELVFIQTKIHGHSKSERLKKLQQEVNDEIQTIESRLERMKLQLGQLAIPIDAHSANLGSNSRLTDAEINNLMQVYSIKSKPILIQSLAVLLVTILLFFVQSLPGTNLTLGWVSLFAGLTLLVLSSSTKVPEETGHNGSEQQHSEEEEQEHGEQSVGNFERVINNIEWSTLMFFFSLFIVMEVMAKLGLISFLGKQITLLVEQTPPGRWRSVGAITIILWASGIASACIDNVPFTSMMIRVLGTMIIDQNASARASNEMNPIEPLVFALAFGACYGGNGTLIGASANLVTAGISGRYGYPFSFNGFFKFTMPITLISLAIANIYLVLVYVVFGLGSSY